MRLFDDFGHDGPPAQPLPIRQVVIQRRLGRVLAFTRLTIDDVVNDPIAKNKVLGYYKLSKLIDWRDEIVDLERQWNPNGRGG